AVSAERLRAHRVDGAARDQLPRDFRGDRAGEQRQAVRVVGGAVQRVDDEAQLAAPALAALLGQHGGARRALAQQPEDALFRRAGVPAAAMSSAIRRASTRSDSGTLAMAVGWLMSASAAPAKACAYSSCGPCASPCCCAARTQRRAAGPDTAPPPPRSSRAR